MALRRFVLEPAAQIAAEMVHPTTGSTIGQLLERVTMRAPLAITSIENARSWLMNERQNGKCIGIVPTMGALHAGHLSLVERSRRECDATVATIFINPKQFSPNEDFSRYPRQLEKDLELLAQGGADIVFAPSVGEMYPTGFATSVHVGGLSDRWEGASRPGHFAGVTTVVAKLLNIFPSDKAYFGQKDYQQYLLIRRMAIDLNLLTEIVACPIVREPDGLAMSSRNAYLSADDRRRALALYRGLQAGKSLFYAGELKTSSIQAAVIDEITRDLGVKLDYATVVDAETLEEVEIIERPAVILIAAKVGATRLIDNALLTPSSDE
jgi:pantoate--beta-alanine ligase